MMWLGRGATSMKRRQTRRGRSSRSPPQSECHRAGHVNDNHQVLWPTHAAGIPVAVARVVCGGAPIDAGPLHVVAELLRSIVLVADAIHVGFLGGDAHKRSVNGARQAA